METSNAGGVGQHRDLGQYLAPSRGLNDSTATCNTLGCDEPLQVVDTCRW